MDLDALLRPAGASRPLRDVVFPRPLTILVAAPHPDDFDAIAVTLRHLHAQGHAIRLAVLTSGAGGVDDGFAGTLDASARTLLREAEQRASCDLFGLAPEAVSFLRLWGGDDSDAPLAAWMAAHPADLVFLPHGNDSNRTHRRTFEAVTRLAAAHGRPAWALLNQDAKTVAMRPDVHVDFDEAEAAWKASLLRCHRSQQERNLRTRGIGFDQRVLAVNRAAAVDLGAATTRPYAEVFELMRLCSAVSAKGFP